MMPISKDDENQANERNNNIICSKFMDGEQMNEENDANDEAEDEFDDEMLEQSVEMEPRMSLEEEDDDDGQTMLDSENEEQVGRLIKLIEFNHKFEGESKTLPKGRLLSNSNR